MSNHRDVRELPTFIKLIGLVAILLATVLAYTTDSNAQEVGDTIEVTVDRPNAVHCIDGDTCELEGLDRDLRLAGIDAPEINGPCPIRAKLAQEELSKIMDYRPLQIRIVDIGEFDRYIVEIDIGNINVSDWMLHRNLVTRWPIREPSTLCDNGSKAQSREIGTERVDLASAFPRGHEQERNRSSDRDSHSTSQYHHSSYGI